MNITQSPPPVDIAEEERIKREVEDVVASMAMEGMETTPEGKMNLLDVVSGRRSADEIIAEIKAKAIAEQKAAG